ncbi:hypothetical protein HGQ17_03220 [Nesterenkonia sp. MY13]|uniref:Uncharacterized protein n=1 Tax=Nesterenkonia sedimenti TaxID=1463632 RepID=A0A7X8YD54_9MICC|nr:hypothetical protein [Nesterenkonia sedimenti]NLS09026.1 hypothetical protein [Nesterenkonia sedimenti]
MIFRGVVIGNVVLVIVIPGVDVVVILVVVTGIDIVIGGAVPSERVHNLKGNYS